MLQQENFMKAIMRMAVESSGKKQFHRDQVQGEEHEKANWDSLMEILCKKQQLGDTDGPTLM